jgi:ribosome-associated translation inhibitor RaiA
MRIEVIGEDGSSDAQARTYAEYRVFAALARHMPHVRGARVVLRRNEVGRKCEPVVCAVTVALAPSGSARTRAGGQHAYAAINRAVQRIGDLMHPRAAQRR